MKEGRTDYEGKKAGRNVKEERTDEILREEEVKEGRKEYEGRKEGLRREEGGNVKEGICRKEGRKGYERRNMKEGRKEGIRRKEGRTEGRKEGGGNLCLRDGLRWLAYVEVRHWCWGS